MVLVSVVIPSFNRFKYLQNAISSVQAQTMEDHEIIIVNDGSTEKEYYESSFPKNTKVININRSETPNWGGSRPAVRNYGIDVAEGEYVAFLDDDDIWMPNKLEMQIDQIKQTKIEFSSTEGYFGYGVFDKKKNYPLYNSEHYLKKIKRKYRRTNYIKNNKFPKIWDYKFIEKHNCVILSSVLVKKQLIEELGGFRGLYRSERYKNTSDHDCWLGLLQLSDLVYIDEPLFYYDAGHGDEKNYKN